MLFLSLVIFNWIIFTGVSLRICSLTSESQAVPKFQDGRPSQGLAIDNYRTLFDGGFDPGSERTLAAWFRHASRAIPQGIAAKG